VRAAVIALVVAVTAACGGGGSKSAASIRTCIDHHLPAGAVDRVFASAEEGVTSLNYFHNGGETDVTIFKSGADAIDAEKAEARLGDAHDRRLKNVLYSGGGAIEAAVVRCVK
jgi:hypothetical protein